MTKNSPLMELNTQLASALAEYGTLTREHGEDLAAMPAGQRERAERLGRQMARLEEQITDAEAREAKVEAVRDAHGAGRVESGFHAPDIYAKSSRKADPWSDLGHDVTRSDTFAGLNSRAHDAIEQMHERTADSGRERLARMLEDDQSVTAAAYVVATTDPAYERAFIKAIGSQHGYRLWDEQEQRAFSRVESLRASMSLTSANGGYLVPTPLDPSIVLTNSSVVNPVRRLATNHTTTAATWNGAASAGSTAYWTSENTAVTDSSPTFAAITATPRKLTAWLTGSFEVADDSNIANQIPMLVGDAFDVAEGAAFVTGSGTPPTPQGIVTAVAAVTASRVSPTTGGSFTANSVADLYKVDNALTARSRANGVTWIANRATINLIRQMSATANGSSFWANLGDKVDGINAAPLLIDHPLYEASAMTSTVTTGSALILAGDFRTGMAIVDRIGTVIEYVQNVVDGSGIPTGTRGWLGWKRTTTVVSNVDAFRVLQL